MRRVLIAVGLAAAAAVAAGPAAIAQTEDPGALERRGAALDAAAAWGGVLEAHRAPQTPAPGETESVIVLLRGAPAVAAPPARRAAAAAALVTRQERVESTLGDLGATVTFRYRVLINGLALRVPTGRLAAVAELPEVAAVIPVSFLAPAQAGPAPAPTVAPQQPGPTRPVLAPGPRPAHIALIDAGIVPEHPALGGGVGPTFPVIGGADLVDGDDEPVANPGDPDGEAHGTQMAGLVLGSSALAGLAPASVPRLLAYRVVAREPVGGRLRPLARSDRVLAALERAVDPDGDGDPADRAEVILLGLAAGFDGAGVDPVRQAVARADATGATVVVAAGNDGPTFTVPGSVGGPAAAPTAVAVGGLSDRAPQTARLRVNVATARAALGPLPAMGPTSGVGEAPVAFVVGPDGLLDGTRADHYRGPSGQSVVTGALAVVARGNGSFLDVATLAAEAGAVGVAVWDGDDSAAFPGLSGGDRWPVPVVGLGPRQGEALAQLTREHPDLTVSLEPESRGAAPAAVASFSSQGPTVAGRAKPDLVADAIDRPTAYPPRGPGEPPRSATLTGTSAAAADVAARALRLRIDRPGLGPRAVHSLLIQGTTPMERTSVPAQGAGVAGPPPQAPAVFDPPIVPGRVVGDSTAVRAMIHDIGGGGGTYLLRLRRPDGTERPLRLVRLAAGGKVEVSERVPGEARGRLELVSAAGSPVAWAPVEPLRTPAAPHGALGTPEVTVGEEVAEVRVRLGRRARVAGRLVNQTLHGVRISLQPQPGGRAQPIAGAKQDGDWPPGTYRFLVARRLADGGPVGAGRYRVLVTGTAADGTRVQRASTPFDLR